MTDYSTGEGQKRLMAESMGLPSDTYTRRVNTSAPGDYGADPIGDGSFRMVPSGDVVDWTERMARLAQWDSHRMAETGTGSVHDWPGPRSGCAPNHRKSLTTNHNQGSGKHTWLMTFST